MSSKFKWNIEFLKSLVLWLGRRMYFGTVKSNFLKNVVELYARVLQIRIVTMKNIIILGIMEHFNH